MLTAAFGRQQTGMRVVAVGLASTATAFSASDLSLAKPASLKSVQWCKGEATQEVDHFLHYFALTSFITATTHTPVCFWHYGWYSGRCLYLVFGSLRSDHNLNYPDYLEKLLHHRWYQNDFDITTAGAFISIRIWFNKATDVPPRKLSTGGGIIPSFS